MKIAMVTAFYGPAFPTGSGIFASETAEILGKKGHDVHLFTSNVGSLDGVGSAKNFTLHLKKSRGLIWDMNPLADVFFDLSGKEFDIVHVHSYIFLMSSMAAAARGFSDFKYLLHFHGGLAHGGDGSFQQNRMMAKELVFDKTLGKFTVCMADKVASVSKADIPLIKDKFGVESEYIQNAIDPIKFQKNDQDANTVTYIGKFEEWKGFSNLLKIFEEIHRKAPNTKFKVVGRGSLEHLIENSNLPIEWTGHVPHRSIPEIYHGTSVLLLPSFMEGSPTVCMEALASEVPVVATDVGDTKEIVKSGENGYLRKPLDIKGMADDVVSLLNDDGLRARMGMVGRQHIVNNFSYSSVVEKIETTYTTMLDKN